jgi:pyruvate dehydrogenase E1 component
MIDAGQGPNSLQNVTLLGSGAILTEVIQAAQQLAAQGVDVTVYSVTSWSELAREGRACLQRRLNGEADVPMPFITRQLQGSSGPIIAATDYVVAVPESIRAYVPEGRRYLTLGTDGFGRSDTRAALRGYFGVDAGSIVRAVLACMG